MYPYLKTAGKTIYHKNKLTNKYFRRPMFDPTRKKVNIRQFLYQDIRIIVGNVTYVFKI